MIKAAEVAEVMRTVARGERKLIPSAGPFRPGDCFHFHAHTDDGWRFVVFIDGGDLDYVDEATAPDGRWADFDAWAEEDGRKQGDAPAPGDNNPSDLLGDDFGAFVDAMEALGPPRPQQIPEA